MKIDFLTNDGSPLGVTLQTLHGNDPKQIGVGGAELAMLTMCEAWHKQGHSVTLYNNPRNDAGSPFPQLPIAAFSPDKDRDILIIFRSPNVRAVGAKGMKVWWSCDQQTVGDFAQFRQLVDKVVVISPRHAEFFKLTYGITDAICIDLPVRSMDYDGLQVDKVKNRILFSSVPARGLNEMLDIFPRIRNEVPDATLVVTSDYRLWGCELGRGNEQFMARALTIANANIYGALIRQELVMEQLKSELHVYPSNYDELFCIAVAESQYAGVATVTSDTGALPTTNMGIVIPGDTKSRSVQNKYVETVVELLTTNKKYELANKTSILAQQRFHINTISDQWNKKVFGI